MSEEISITIKSSGDQKYSVTVDTSNTVLQLKEKIALEADIPATSQRLIYSGRVLKDTELVSFYKVQSGHTIHLVKSAAAPKPEASSSATAATPANTATTTPANSNIPSNIAAGQGAFNPLAGLTGARYAGLAQLPSASMFGADGGMGPMPDENQLSEMMESPMFQEGMRQMLNDPNMMNYLIEQSPQLRAMGPQAREMLQSEQFRSMMSNPQMMRQMMSFQRAMGGGGFGGAAQNAFPAPGNATGQSDTATTQSTGADSQAGAAANPFASLFPGGAPPANPFAAFGNQNNAFANPELLNMLLGGGGAGAGAAPVPVDNRPPEERYESQLRQLNDMGFFDFDSNVQALRRSGGSVQGAIEFLLSNF